ncbi:hypothetical protein IKQ21_00510 [bacterium]|nr:hypothetical protein [bacterium]
MKLLPVSPKDIRITPTEKKLRRAASFAQAVSESLLPKEMPIEHDVYIKTPADEFAQVKNTIQLAVENIKEGCI